MDASRMIAEIKTACSALERRKQELTAEIMAVDEKLSAYRKAIDSLVTTVDPENRAEPVCEKKPENKFGRRTVLTLNGKSQTLIQWAKQLRMSPEGIQYRLNHGWSVEDTLSRAKISYKTPVKPKKVFAYDCHDNVIRQYSGVGDASRDLNLPVSTIQKIIEKMTRDDQLRVRNYYLTYVA